MFFCCPFDALGSTMATYGGQNVGAKKMERISGGLKACSILGVCYAVIAFGILLATGSKLAGFFVETAESEVIRNAQQFLVVNSAFYIALAFVNIVRFLIQGMATASLPSLPECLRWWRERWSDLCSYRFSDSPQRVLASPVAWVFADMFLFPAYFHVFKKTKKMLGLA